MRTYFKLSAIALFTTAISGLPAHALSLNLGGNGPLLDLGNGNNANATVSVETGNLLGTPANDNVRVDAAVEVNRNSVLGSTSSNGTGGIINDGGDGGVVNHRGNGGVVNLGGNGGLVNLGDTNDSDDGIIDIELGSTGGTGGGLLDLGGQGSLLDLGGQDGVIANVTMGGDGGLLDLGDSELIDLDSLGLTDGPLLDLSGDPNVDALIEIDIVNADLLDLGSTGSIRGDLLDLDGDLLDLGSDTEDLVALNLLGTTVDADVNLGGDAPLVDVNIGTGDNGVAGTGLLPDTNVDATVGGDNLATVTVTTGDDETGNGGNGSGSGGNGNGGNGAGGHGTGGNAPGNNGGANGNGNNGTGGGMAPGDSGSTSSGTDLAAVSTSCLTFTSAEIDQLIKRHTYNRATFNSWAGAQSLKIVEVDLCDREIADVAAAVGASANVARLQAFLAAQAKVRAGLQSRGFAPGDVIAADHSGEILTVYVI